MSYEFWAAAIYFQVSSSTHGLFSKDWWNSSISSVSEAHTILAGSFDLDGLSSLRASLNQLGFEDTNGNNCFISMEVFRNYRWIVRELKCPQRNVTWLFYHASSIVIGPPSPETPCLFPEMSEPSNSEKSLAGVNPTSHPHPSCAWLGCASVSGKRSPPAGCHINIAGVEVRCT